MTTMTEDIAESVKLFMRSYPQGVTIVTAENAGKPFGVTVSAFSSISLDPPLVMISMTRGTKAHDILAEAETFTISLLSAEQAHLSDRFAGRSESQRYDFGGLRVSRGLNGCLYLQSAVGHLECKRWSSHVEGDHTLVFGRVTAGSVDSETTPLLYYRRRYTTVVQPAADSEVHDSLLAEW